MRIVYHNQFIFCVLISMMSACGLHYTAPETPEAFEIRRHKAVESYVQSTTKNEGYMYESVAFGETQIVKPNSYRTLDSLYALKYNNELKGLKMDALLDEKIGNQRIIARNDTNRVIYIENHVFALTSDTTTEIYGANFQVSSELVVHDMIIRESTFLPKRDTERYKQYLFNESFLNLGNPPNSSESKFYTLFTNRFNELSKDQRDLEVRHMLQIMEIAQRRASLGTEGILKTLAALEILGNISVSELVNTASKLTTSNFQFIKASNEPASQVIGYTFVLAIEPSQGNGSIAGYAMEYDRYFHLVRKEKLY
jgi:hypothetical protein